MKIILNLVFRFKSNSRGEQYSNAECPAEYDTDPRELESFAERFKQRRIKLSVTQADVGQALGKLKIGQEFEPVDDLPLWVATLSHNNMVALKPIYK